MTNRADQNWPKGEAYELGMDTGNTVCVGRVHTAVDAPGILKYDGRMFERLLSAVDNAVKSNDEVR